ncbi:MULTISPECIES: hypothetical protein [Salinisphaera]|uniref:Copper resistance protein D domain-containing protein n=1 Tax=Salinisphaera hydrothermalis (strain C41B8) TaxID=1304275 RepID=A0A084IIZ6_SALHC|nr:hypothetical protein [Salinisphaera hydrothermalis]KEZ76680.1 hypothetical protein C41B8_13735 [Salinisphaera hydrothermalis C41B8]
MAITNKARRLGAWGIFLVAWAAVLVVAFAIAAIGLSMAGGAVEFRDWGARIVPYALIWRVGVYVVIGTLYIKRWRPRLRALQQRQSDGGEAARQRLVRVEWMLLAVIVVTEGANLPDLVNWITAS